MKESEVLRDVLLKLDTYKITGDVIWVERLNSGKINSGLYWVKGCAAGTPDVISIINCKDGKIAVLFIECKRSGVKRLRYEQKQFFESMDGKPMIMCTIINDPKQLWTAIKKARSL